MVTLQQLQDGAREFHYTGPIYRRGRYRGNQSCTCTIGPRGGIKIDVMTFRASGQLKTWKRSPGRFRLPVKFGLRNSYEITDANAHMWHVASECPLSTGVANNAVRTEGA